LRGSTGPAPATVRAPLTSPRRRHHVPRRGPPLYFL